MCSSLGCLIALQVLLYRHLLALTVRNPLLVLWRPNAAALRKVSIRAGWQADENFCFSDFLEIQFQHFSSRFLIYNARNKVRNLNTL